PPSAEASPANPAPGITQVFTFGHDTVARVHWGSNSVVPNTVDVKQFTDTKGPLFPAGANFMYFYTDIDAANITYNYTADIYYKDPWTGTIGSESDLRMAHKVGTQPWVAYNGSLSSTDGNRNLISATNLNATGLFTGIENDVLFSAIITASGNPVFC